MNGDFVEFGLGHDVDSGGDGDSKMYFVIFAVFTTKVLMTNKHKPINLII